MPLVPESSKFRFKEMVSDKTHTKISNEMSRQRMWSRERMRWQEGRGETVALKCSVPVSQNTCCDTPELRNIQ